MAYLQFSLLLFMGFFSHSVWATELGDLVDEIYIESAQPIEGQHFHTTVRSETPRAVSVEQDLEPFRFKDGRNPAKQLPEDFDELLTEEFFEAAPVDDTNEASPLEELLD